MSKYISTAEARSLCRTLEYPLSKQGLIYVGEERGFIRKKNDGWHWEFEYDALISYIKEKKALLCSDWHPVRFYAEIYSVTVCTIYVWIRKYNLKVRYAGKNNLMHIQEDDLKRVYTGIRVYRGN
jgi:hypothetical protein